MKPAIIVVTYNRPNSLCRILESLQSAKYDTLDIPLVISIDYQDSQDHEKVVEIAEKFNWKYGEKVIIEHTTNLGLRKHILSCGDMSKKYESIIVLEDDLFVSPYFYKYTVEAQTYYKSDVNIGGVSLYNHKINFNIRVPFEPLPSNSDVYFLKIASSWGQSWTYNQWKSFREWYDKSNILHDFEKVPKYVKGWPKSSWLKFFISYLEENNKYFVYPKTSLSTNFSDVGTHNTAKNNDFQVPILIETKNYVFENLENSINKYDSFFEISPDIIKYLNVKFRDKDFTVDMYGTKDNSKINTKYLLSSKVLKDKTDFIFNLGLDLKPITMNSILNIQGDFFNFSEVSSFSEIGKMKIKKIEVYNYFFQKLTFKTFVKILINKIKNYLLNG